MKKSILLLILSFVLMNAKAQYPCQAFFTYTINPSNNEIALNDQSFNIDSSLINVTSWLWTVNDGTQTNTYSVQNPVINYDSVATYVEVCLSITTQYMGALCQSTYCDTINLLAAPDSTCFGFISVIPNGLNADIMGYVFTGNGFPANVTSWQWTFPGGNPGVSGTQSTNVSYSAPGSYTACFTAITDLGCTLTVCDSFTVGNSSNCILTINADIYHVSVPGGNDGAIELNVSGGTPPYFYNWNGLGLSTPDIYNLSSGFYTATITQADSTCVPYSFTAYIMEPYDSSNIIIDTLVTGIIDTCFNFVPDSFYVAGISIVGDTVYVQWVFTGGGMVSTITASYLFSVSGAYVVVLTINCNGFKNLTTYMSYIYIHPSSGITEAGENTNFTLYPNPVQDVMYVSLQQPLTDKSNVCIYDAGGRLITSLDLEEGSLSFEVNTSKYLNGIYMLLLNNGSNQPIKARFIK